MTDTIELLEAIGSDASLRHARADELKCALEQVQASGRLVTAVAEGNSALLREGYGLHQAPQITQAPAQEPGKQSEEDEDDALQSGQHQAGRSSPQSLAQESSY